MKKFLIIALMATCFNVKAQVKKDTVKATKPVYSRMVTIAESDFSQLLNIAYQFKENIPYIPQDVMPDATKTNVQINIKSYLLHLPERVRLDSIQVNGPPKKP